MNTMDPDDSHDTEQADKIIAEAPLAGYGTHLRKSRDQLVARVEQLEAENRQFRHLLGAPLRRSGKMATWLKQLHRDTKDTP